MGKEEARVIVILESFFSDSEKFVCGGGEGGLTPLPPP
jgi:hypothetical protein